MVVKVLRRRRLLIAAILFTLFVSFNLWQSRSRNPSITNYDAGLHGLTFEVISTSRDKRASASQYGATECNIPVLDINGSEVIRFFKKPEPLNCAQKSYKNWAFVDDNRFFALIPERAAAVCHGTGLIRVSDHILHRTDPIPLVAGRPLPHDFVSASCTHGRNTWSGLLMSVVPQKAREEYLKQVEHPADWSGLNVFILGFDSLSQMSFRRNLPKTVAFLENELGSVVLNGYNIVGDGTPQAYIPILTGATEEELPLTRKRFTDSKFVDDAYPFVWKNFSSAGYITAYGEDVALVDTFIYRLKGFRRHPTDHYTRTFFQETESVLWDAMCHGSEPYYKNWLRYSGEFLSAYPTSIPKFLLLHQNLLSHDSINLIAVMDNDFEAFLRSLHQKGFFDETLVIIMADHGNRFAELRATHQGQLEERLPFFSLALPKKFRESAMGKEAYANLKANAARLTSPFDIYRTLLDIIHWPTDFTTVQESRKSRSLSLWRPIAEDRTCEQAGIEPHWCTCLDWKDAMKTDDDKQLSMQIAQAVVDAINEQTVDERKVCTELSLKSVDYAKKLVPKAGVMAYKNVKDADGFVPDLSGSTKTAFAHYQVKLSTTPGRAIYEVTVAYFYKDRKVQVDLTSISHVNKYGDDPHCIINRNYFLATFCVCYDRI